LWCEFIRPTILTIHIRGPTEKSLSLSPAIGVSQETRDAGPALAPQ
jgi:hypothetical protein